MQAQQIYINKKMAEAGEKSYDPGTRIKNLSAQANNVQMDKNIPPRRYFRSGVELERMASTYLNENNLENAFVLYMKFIVLFVEKLPKHPQYKQADPVQIKNTMTKVRKILPMTEKLKMTIKRSYEEEYQEWKKEELKRITEIEEKKRQEAEAEYRRQLEQQNSLQNHKQTEENQIPTALSTFVAPILTPSAPYLEADYPSAPQIPDELRNNELPSPPPYSSIHNDVTIQDVPLVIPGTILQDVPPVIPGTIQDVPPVIPGTIQDVPPVIPGTKPDVPPVIAGTKPDVPPVIPGTKPDVPLVIPGIYSQDQPRPTPTVDRSSKPCSLIDRQVSTLVDGLRRIYFPNELMSKFLELASSNTRMNLETCGILTGKLARNLFHITHLVIPKQTATSDSCTTSNEEEMFDVQDKYDLVTLGWIHTHPSQTSFLSSVDLHTQYSYQMLMPEAIAIVCAPKFNQVGVYRLTSNHGVSFIGSCSKPGFHPHPKEPPLFEEAEHAQSDSTMNIKVIDLR